MTHEYSAIVKEKSMYAISASHLEFMFSLPFLDFFFFCFRLCKLARHFSDVGISLITLSTTASITESTLYLKSEVAILTKMNPHIFLI